MGIEAGTEVVVEDLDGCIVRRGGTGELCCVVVRGPVRFVLRITELFGRGGPALSSSSYSISSCVVFALRSEVSANVTGLGSSFLIPPVPPVCRRGCPSMRPIRLPFLLPWPTISVMCVPQCAWSKMS